MSTYESFATDIVTSSDTNQQYNFLIRRLKGKQGNYKMRGNISALKGPKRAHGATARFD